MSDVADMIVEGILCEACGVYIEDDEAAGYPRQCNDCKPRNKKQRKRNRRRKDKQK